MKQSTFNVLISFVVCCLIIIMVSDHIPKKPKLVQTVKIDTLYIHEVFIPTNPETDLYGVIEYYGIKYPHIVYAQAVLETGHFTSKNCLVNNNLFGLYDSKNKRYFKFNSWIESVKAYKDLIQYKFHEDSNKPPNDERYYEFLINLGYASDKDYIKKIKNIVKRYE